MRSDWALGRRIVHFPPFILSRCSPSSLQKRSAERHERRGVGCKTFCDGDKRAEESERRYRPTINPPGSDINIPNCVWAVRFALLFPLNLFPASVASLVLFL